MLKVGDLVQIKPGIQPPRLYGAGAVVKVLRRCEITDLPVRVAVHWSKQNRVGDCAVYSLEVISESR
jgi:hypothetical protein